MGITVTPTYGQTLLGGLGGVVPCSPPGSPGIGHNSLMGSLSAPTTYQWLYVRQRFTQFLANLALTDQQQEDGSRSQTGVRACLNRHYWGHSSETLNSMLIGSWGKRTQVRPPRDVDVLFLLPAVVYHRFELRSGNKQSQLLQEVKDVLLTTYSRTAMRGDRHVILVPFADTTIELLPGFRCQDGSIIVCDSVDGGSYKVSTAEAELADLENSDLAWLGNTRALVRMMKQWQRNSNVPLKSFQIERLAIEFLRTWPFSLKDFFWYDWMVRDFLAYLIGRANGYIIMPGSNETIWLGSDWLSRAQTAYASAIEACTNERDNYGALAGNDWQKIFGASIPVLV